MTNSKFTIALIPVLLSVILLPQLFYYWLAPASAVSHVPVYYLGSLLTTIPPIISFAAYWLFGLRKSAGLAIMACILELIAITVCILLLVVDASIRSSLFALTITLLVYLICLLPMFISAMKPNRISVSPIEPIEQHDDYHNSEFESHQNARHVGNNESSLRGTMRPTSNESENNRNSATPSVPLPPRNR